MAVMVRACVCFTERWIKLVLVGAGRYRVVTGRNVSRVSLRWERLVGSSEGELVKKGERSVCVCGDAELR